MNILETYKFLIAENEIGFCVKKFGHELFGHELGGKEKNTPIENAYVGRIEDFSRKMYGKNIDTKFINAINTLKSCINQYPEVLIPEKTTVYRGINIPVKYFIENKIPIDIRNKQPYIYKAKSNIQSWSTDFKAASLFGNHDQLNNLAKEIKNNEKLYLNNKDLFLKKILNENLSIGFILEHLTDSKEFMFKSKYFRILSNSYHEDEILRIKNEPIKCLIKFNDSGDVFLTYDALSLISLINKAIINT